jgi:uncharacterized NAD(P)/FAD-binding protein YdhS
MIKSEAELVMGAFFPDMIREKIRDMLAEEGITREDLEEIVRKQERPMHLRPDPLSIGLDIDEEYSLIDASSRRSNRVRAIGPLTRAAFWECIAIPDIRAQCGDLA